MPGEIKYYFDSYAIVAVLDDAEAYRRFNVAEGVTTTLNLMETQYALYKKGVKEAEIKRALDDLSPMCIGFSEGDCFEAVRFRYANRRKRLSYFDCLGYILSEKNEVPFLTGDKEFEGLENVEFVRIE